MRGSKSRVLLHTCLLVILIGWFNCIAHAQPSSDAKPGEAVSPEATNVPEPVVLQAARFQGVTPGESTLAEVKEKLGEPVSEQVSAANAVLEYQVGPFPKVEIFLTDDTVVLILAQLGEGRDPSELAIELGLDAFVPVAVETNGETLGIAFPERGVLFSYAANTEQPLVTQLLLEPLSAEMFLLRAEATPSDQYSRKLTDLERVLDIEPENTEALWLGGKLLAATGKQEAALKLVKKAVRLSPDDDRYQLTQAKFQADIGDHKKALATVNRVLNRPDSSSLDQAKAKLALGNLLATGLNRDYKAAIKHHLAAIKSTTPLVSEKETSLRHEAERVLIEAYLGAANDIAQGEWDRKPEVVPKWLRSAEELATRFVDEDGADGILQLIVWRRTLEAYAAMEHEVVDTPAVIEAAQQAAEQLIEGSDDPLYRERVQWELLRANFAALRVEQTSERYSDALKYAGDAVRAVESLPSDRIENEYSRYLIGRLYFYVGTIYAISHKDHTEAVRWYERALPHLEAGLPKSELFDTGIHGERFVSMGVSYWKAELEDEGLKLTERGLDLMERAATAGLLDRNSLKVPYTNLAEMHRAGGRNDTADSFSAKVARLNNGETQR
jgi:tetratricopeptide (TPR) repeat protein